MGWFARGLLVGALVWLSGPARADTIVIEADQWCPYTCAEGTAEPGYLIELAQAALATRGHQVVYRVVPWVRALEDVRQGRAQAAAGATDGDRGEGLEFPALSQGRSINAFLVRAADPWAFADLPSLAGRTVGVVKDYTYGEPIDGWISRNAIKTEAISGDNAVETNLKKLQAGRIDTVLDDSAVLDYLVARLGLKDQVRTAGTTEATALYIIFSSRSNGGRYAAELSAGLGELRASGQLKQILSRYQVSDWQP